MRIVFTDENSRLKDFAELIDSTLFKNFVNANLGRISKYDYGMVRVQPHLCKDVFNAFLIGEGFEIGNKTEHAHNIGNNNMIYIQDMYSGEFIGALHLNSNMYSSMYCYATDINNNRVSKSYCIHPKSVSIEQLASVDWNKYQFQDSNERTSLAKQSTGEKPGKKSPLNERITVAASRGDKSPDSGKSGPDGPGGR